MGITRVYIICHSTKPMKNPAGSLPHMPSGASKTTWIPGLLENWMIWAIHTSTKKSMVLRVMKYGNQSFDKDIFFPQDFLFIFKRIWHARVKIKFLPFTFNCASHFNTFNNLGIDLHITICLHILKFNCTDISSRLMVP